MNAFGRGISVDAFVRQNSFNFEKRMKQRYGFTVDPVTLMQVIAAGHATEVFNQRDKKHRGRRCFDVPVSVGGQDKIVRTVVSADFFKVFCVLPPPRVVTPEVSR
jgi:hypothetical protein